MHRHTPMCMLQNSGIHINSHMSWYVPQHSTAFSNHHLPYLQFLDSPHVSLYFQTTKGICCSLLDLSALPSLMLTQLPFSLPVCQSVSQAVSPFTSSSHQPRMPIHKNKKKILKITQRGISSGGKQKQCGRGEQSVILGSVCVAEWLVWSLESGSLLCVAHVGRAREWEEGREGSSTALWRCHTTSFYSRVGSWKIIIPHPPPQHKFKRTV